MEIREKLPLSTIITASHNRTVLSHRVVLLAMMFVTLLIISNLTAFKVVELTILDSWKLDFPAGLVVFPMSYFVDDVITEVYGYKTSRLFIWGGIICRVMVTTCMWMIVQLPASPLWDAQTNHGSQAYELILSGSARILSASLISYFCGGFINAIALAKLKVASKGKKLYARIMLSTLLGTGVDTLIFCLFAFSGVLPQKMIWAMIVFQYLFKVCYEFIMLPATYWLTSYLKRVDRVDYYDDHTNFNPFSLKT